MIGTSLLTLLPEAASAMTHIVLGGLLLAGIFLGTGIELLVMLLHKSRTQPKDLPIDEGDEAVNIEQEKGHQWPKRGSVSCPTHTYSPSTSNQALPI